MWKLRKFVLISTILIFSIVINKQYVTNYPNNTDKIDIFENTYLNPENSTNFSQKLSLEENLVGYWNFDEANGSIANDSSIYENDGTIDNPFWTPDGVLNSALNFYSVNWGYVQLQHITEYNFGTDTDFTISTWIKTSVNSTKGRIFSKGSYNFAIQGYMMSMNYNKILLETTNQTGYVNMLESNSTVNDNEWHYIVGIVDRDQDSRIYIDGVLDAVRAFDTSSDSFDTAINPIIGRYDASAIEGYVGSIDEFKLYNKALNETEIATKYLEFSKINIVTPKENETYKEPMAGYYPATYGFENEVIGTSSTDIDFVDNIANPTPDTVIEIREELEGHKNYLYMKKDGSNGGISNYFENQLSGTIEYYFRVNDASEIQQHFMDLYDGAEPVIAIRIRNDNFDYVNSDNIPISCGVCLDNVWYHSRIDFYSDNTFTWYVNQEVLVDRQPNRINMTDGIDRLYFGEYDGFAEMSLDAIGYSWDVNSYQTGSNLEEGLLISYTTFLEVSFVRYSIDSQPYMYLYPGNVGNFTIPFLEEGDHTIIINVYSSIGFLISELRSFTVLLDPEPPTITGPADFSFNYGLTGYSILWSVSGYYPLNYTVFLNGSVYDYGSWNSIVIISLDGLSEGLNIFVCVVNNTIGLNSSDEVQVTVLPAAPDETPPVISTPLDISFENGSIGFSIIWSASDDQAPWWFSVRKNSTLIYDQAWIGNDIEISLDGLAIGYYIYNCTVYDKSWNFQSSFVAVNVTEAVPDNQPPVFLVEPPPLEYEEGLTGNFLTWQIIEDHPYAYRILINSSEQIFNPWHGENITFNIDGLTIGKYYVNLTVWDLTGYAMYSVIVVTVIPSLPDLTSPVVSQPVDLFIAENMTGAIIWEVNDINPDVYTISRNGTLIVEEKDWMSGIIRYSFISLPLGTWEFALTVYDQSGNSVVVIAIVIVLPSDVYDYQSPQINQLPNTEIIYGTSGNSLIFYLFDQHPSSYSISINGSLITENCWASPNIKVEFSLDSLYVGFYDIIIYAEDIFGNIAFREVFVTVVGDITPPSISSPSDIVTSRGISEYLIWIVDDDYPSHYEFLLMSNGIVTETISTGNWSGSSISLYLGSLDLGTHNIRCVVYDKSGNYAYDEVIIVVNESKTFSPGFELGTTLLLLSILVFSNKVKKRRNRND